MSKIVCRFAVAYLQGRVKIPIGGKVREPKGQHAGIAAQRLQGTSRWNYGTDSDPVWVSLDERRTGRAWCPVSELSLELYAMSYSLRFFV